MRKNIFLSLNFLVLILGACNARNSSPEVPSVSQPANTLSISPTSTVFITPTEIMTLSVTMESVMITPEIASGPNYDECSQWGLFTLDKNWTLCDPMVDPITLVNKSNQVWQFSYKAYYGKDILYPCTKLLYSTNDGNYLYFSLDEECIMAEPGFDSSIGVFRLNLVNGDISEILKAVYDFENNDGNAYSESISPTGRRMAYIYPQKSPLTLNILDLQTGETRSFPLEEKFVGGGRYQWSEDGTKLVFLLASEKDYDLFVSMVYLDLLKSNSIVTFLKDKKFTWMSSTIEVADNGIKIIPVDDVPLFYDIETRILIPVDK